MADFLLHRMINENSNSNNITGHGDEACLRNYTCLFKKLHKLSIKVRKNLATLCDIYDIYILFIICISVRIKRKMKRHIIFSSMISTAKIFKNVLAGQLHFLLDCTAVYTFIINSTLPLFFLSSRNFHDVLFNDCN